MKLGENAIRERQKIRTKYRDLYLQGNKKTWIYEELGRMFGKSARQIINIIKDGRANVD